MKRDSSFFKQAELMLRLIPFFAGEDCFALKGGTAINFFIRDLPRLSVDIDLTYLPVESREISLEKIGAALSRIATIIRKANKYLSVYESKNQEKTRTVKLFVRSAASIQVTIEPNEIMRGTVMGHEIRTVAPKVEEIFELSTEMRTVSIPDMYGGKLCAALDRQHPRDIFDIKLLFENEGITPNIRKAFIVYLAGSDRPIHELLDPKRQDIKAIYDREFLGMTEKLVTYEELVQMREKYITVLHEDMTQEERLFLMSIKECEPKWELLQMPGIETLPSIKWKLLNLAKMKPAKRSEQAAKLKAILRL